MFDGLVLTDPTEGSIVMRIPQRSSYDRIRSSTSTDGLYASGSGIEGNAGPDSDDFADQPWVIVWRHC